MEGAKDKIKRALAVLKGFVGSIIATSGKLRLIVLRMESIRWLVKFIPAKLVDSQRLSKSGTEGLSPINLDCYSFPAAHGV
jgi:hypothetical protein